VSSWFYHIKKKSDDVQMGWACGTEQGVEGRGEESKKKEKTCKK